MTLKHPKAKGTRFEKEIVKKFQDAGYLAERMWGSNGESRGLDSEVDIIVKIPTGQFDRSFPEPNEYVEDFYIQCKSVNKLSEKYKIPESCNATVYKENHGESFILLRLDDFVEKYL